MAKNLESLLESLINNTEKYELAAKGGKELPFEALSRFTDAMTRQLGKALSDKTDKIAAWEEAERKGLITHEELVRRKTKIEDDYSKVVAQSNEARKSYIKSLRYETLNLRERLKSADDFIAANKKEVDSLRRKSNDTAGITEAVSRYMDDITKQRAEYISKLEEERDAWKSTTDSEVLNDAERDAIIQALDDKITDITNSIASKLIAMSDNIIGETDEFIAKMAEDAAKMRNEARGITESVDDVVERFRKNAEKTRDIKIAELEGRKQGLENAKTTDSSHVSEYTEEIKKLDEEIKNVKNSTDDLIDAYREEFKAAEDKRKKSRKWDEALGETLEGWGGKKGGKTGKMLTKMGQGMKGGKGAGIASAAAELAQAAVTYINKEREKEVANLEAKVKTATAEVTAASEKMVRNLTLGGNALAKPLSSFTSALSQGVIEGTFASAANNIQLTSESFSTSIKNFMTDLKLRNQKAEIEKERQTKVANATLEQIEAGANAIAAGVAALPGVSLAAGAAIVGITKLATSLFSSYQKAKNEMELKKLQLHNEYTEKMQEAFNNFAQAGFDAAAKIVEAGQEFYHTISNTHMKINDSATSAGRMLGIGGNDMQRFITETTKRQLALSTTDSKGNVVHMDKDVSDMMKLQTSYAENTGYSVELNDKDYMKTFSLGKLWGDDTAEALTSSMFLFNKSAADSSDIFFEMYDHARKMGISQAKFSKDLVKNLKMAEKYEFKGGTKGLMQMSAWAQKIRFNMDSLDGMLSDIQEGGLENLITKSASLQVLGGQFAMGADPIAMMYEGFNDPQALVERYNNMISGLGRFDKETGEVKYSGGEQMMLSQFAKATGQNLSDVKNQQRQRIRGQEIDKVLTKNYSDKQKDLIYSKATLDENGNWTVNGKDINKLEDSDFTELLPHEEKIEKYVADIYSLMEKDKGITNYGNTKIVAENQDTLDTTAETLMSAQLAFYEDNSAKFSTLIQTAADFTVQSQQEMNNRLLETTNTAQAAYETVLKAMQEETENLTKATSDAVIAMNEFAKNGLPGLQKLFEDATGHKIGKSAQSTALTNRLNVEAFKKSDGSVDVAALSKAIKDNGNKNFYSGDIVKSIEDIRDMTEIRENMSDLELALAYRWDDSGWTNDWKFKDDAEMIRIGALLGEDAVLKNTGHGGFNKDNITMTDEKKIREAIKKYREDHPELVDYSSFMNDGFANSGGRSMSVSASSVVPIQDGTTIAKTDPNDHAIFAKVGGPFDKLFNGVFGRIDDVYNTISDAVEPANFDPYSTVIASMSSDNSNSNNNTSSTNNNNINGHFSFDTLKLEGELKITGSNGQSVDILKELNNNPSFLRDITKYISEGISRQINGGRGISNGGRMVSF